MSDNLQPLAAIRRLDEHSARFFLGMALLAIQVRAFHVALSILNNLVALEAALPVTRLLLAYTHCRASPGHEGRQLLLEVVETYPKFVLAKAVLALEDRVRGIEGWQGLAESVAAGSGMPAILAQCVLDRPVAADSASTADAEANHLFRV